ncbi:hypothetical protein [Actinomadura violacea]|uniref:Uncharacterized protein n=1 Tax=Actinomadura violacea TaxID=2819934 RepID=A0ABS3RZ00_9ACTN|nr:hypothetical protein [Actinomadura violacea]MBO2461688.1 hypothetical protein [Actinomadura violacea]
MARTLTSGNAYRAGPCPGDRPRAEGGPVFHHFHHLVDLAAVLAAHLTVL